MSFPFLSKVYDCCHPVLRAARSNHLVIRWLFGVTVPPGFTVQFDPTTLGMKRLLCEIVTAADCSSLEIGIGQGALISLSLAKSKSLQITGVDCCKQRVMQSQMVAKANGIEADFYESNLFDQVPRQQRFDLIFFNPPYVPTAMGQRLRLSERFSEDGDQTWDGGPDGTKVLESFLESAKGFLTERGKIVFGVQACFVSQTLIESTVKKCGLSIIRRSAWNVLPSVCYVVEMPRA